MVEIDSRYLRSGRRVAPGKSVIIGSQERRPNPVEARATYQELKKVRYLTENHIDQVTGKITRGTEAIKINDLGKGFQG